MLSKLRFPLAMVITAVSLAATAGGIVAVAKANQQAVAAEVDEVKTEVRKIKSDVQAERERSIRIETIVERIERKMDRREREH